MDWDRTCPDCAGPLEDALGGKRVCPSCQKTYLFDGIMLTPFTPARPETPAANPPRARSMASRARQVFSAFHPNEVSYEDAFRYPRPSEQEALLKWMVQEGRTQEAAEYAMAQWSKGLEVELLFPGENADSQWWGDRLERILGRLPEEQYQRLRALQAEKRAPVESMRARLAHFDPERLAPYRQRLGSVMQRFLSTPSGSHPKLSSRRKLPDEGGEYLAIPGGRYEVGPPGGPTRNLRLDPFLIRTLPVTVEDFARFLLNTGFPTPPLWGMRGLDLPRRPVVALAWEEAALYGAWYEARLPTEAEWQVASELHPELFEGSPDWEFVLDDAGDPGGPTGPQGVILLGPGHPKALRQIEKGRRQIGEDERRADTSFRLVLSRPGT